MVSKRFFAGAVALLLLATFLAAEGLNSEPGKDELHFQDSARVFAGGFGLEALHSYPELVTPLSLVIWGELDHLTGDGLYAGRALNLVLIGVVICLVAFSSAQLWPHGARAALGLVLFPYVLPLSVRLYSDTFGAFFVVAGAIALARRRNALAFIAFALAISTRQYLIQIPAALAAAELVAIHRGEGGSWKAIVASAASGLVLLGWVAFFGGLAPPQGIETWVEFYPAPMMNAGDFILHHGLYFLTGIGAYFVVVEALVFRRNPVSALLDRRGLFCALALGALFWLDPPVLSLRHPGGPIGRVARTVLPPPDFDWARVAIYYALALLAVRRFAERIDVGFWLVASGFVLAMKQQLPWEKYLFPTLAVLWTHVSLGSIAAYGAGDARTSAAENGLVKQSLPSPGFKT